MPFIPKNVQARVKLGIHACRRRFHSVLNREVQVHVYLEQEMKHWQY